MARAATRKGHKRRTGKKQAKGGMWPWYLAGMLSIGAVAAYEHRAEIRPLTAPFYTASIAKARSVEKQPAPEKRVEKAQISSRPMSEKASLPMPALAMPAMRPVQQAALDLGEGSRAARKPGTFYFCTETLENCVVDGGTFWYGRRKVQIADIQAPRIKQAKCDNERKLGSLAKKRLWELLNAGDVQLAGSSGPAAKVTVGQGRSVGDMLISEGLARPAGGGKQGWCA